MNVKQGFFLFSLGLVLSVPIAAQYDPFAVKMEYQSYSYKFLDANFEQRLKEAEEKAEFSELRALTEKALIKEKSEILKAEKWVQLAILFEKQRRFHTSAILLQKIAEENIGNRVGEFALQRFSLLLLNHYHLEESGLISYFSRNAFNSLHTDIQSMVSYYKAKYYQRKDFKDWATTEIKKLHKNSPWYYRMQWHSLLQKILGKGEEFPFNEVRSFFTTNQNKLGQLDLKDLYLVSARFLFEQGEFEKAFSVYREYQPYTTRLRGQILLEMAWAKYYQQDYSHALGLLRLLEAPYFESSKNNERYLIEALIYRQLCHYEKIENLEKKFLADFKEVYKLIRSRFGQEKDVHLVNRALLNERLALEVKSLADLKLEIENLEPQAEFYQDLIALMKVREKQLDQVMTNKVKEYLPRIMDDFLLFKQEMGYLSYMSRLDMMRTKANPTSYESEKSDSGKYEKLFWRTNGEYWLDELDDYRVLIDSKCKEEK